MPALPFPAYRGDKVADHINIANPDNDRGHWQHRLHVAKLEAELKVAYAERDHYRDNLEALHTRIGRGDEVWLQIGGEKIIVAAAPPDIQGEGT